MINDNVYYLYVKISNMSPPIWLREPLYERKKMRSNTRPASDIQKKKSNDELVTAELEKILHTNNLLQNENCSLKSEMCALKKENENLVSISNANKDKYNKDFNNLQEEIKKHQKTLASINEKYLLQQKKNFEEVRI